MKIKQVILSKSYTGFYFDDQKAIKGGAKLDGFTYVGEPKTPGFTSIRQPGEAISIQLVLEDGSVAVGDCAAVQYSGAGGRDPLFLADEFIPFIEKEIKPLLIGEDVSKFKELALKYDHLQVNGKRLHTAIRYGITQALLKATALANKLTMAEVIRKEYHIPEKDYHPVAVFTQSGDDRYNNTDKMIIKQADVLPHALINHVETKLGNQGELLLEYIVWLRNRTLKLRKNEQYNPIFHIDTYGTVGIAFNNDVVKMVDYFATLAEAAKPFRLRIEGPVDAGNREDTMIALRDITALLDQRKINVEIVADEWCNTLEDIIYFADNKAGHMLQVKSPDLGGVNNIVEALLYCNKKNIGSYCGGTCNETNISSEITTNIAIACHATQCLARPGMGCDEGFMIVKNEINRVVALANSRR
ncbi:MAG TPA: methylaspartate ammonia-lyase [Bacilli bacterium]|jgi:methylaspartate ammonia-lyase|nr:methylaspartate ammonia-lyase [Acholeplasmataceae bacterium]HNZ77615.1 methylaspartate ammonia-lyase [Bacilli bacterium]HOD60498.1 methylaspartate ammonia-lyase [Bacilli bacterium]HOH62236.1 methylaspartate ammonia-lyase [Bacilli bacterium]HPB49294.1 methylaspartate ammonia-lyase [Bacilli bacterium]